MPGRHVTELLSAFCHGEVSADVARVVSAHLIACARCRRKHDEIRFGIELAGRIARVPAPETVWRGLEAQLDGPSTTAVPAPAWRRTLLYAAGGLLVAVSGFALWYYGFRERLEIIKERATPTAFEVAAKDAHMRRLTGALAFGYVTTSPAGLRAWIRQNAGFDVALAIERPPEDAGRFHLLGATILQAGGARAALVGYEIDSHPVTLLSAPLKDLKDAPADLVFKKRVAYRIDADHGLKLLTWGADGQAYVLVSDLPEPGTDACSLCHTASDRRRLIRESPLKTGT